MSSNKKQYNFLNRKVRIFGALFGVLLCVFIIIFLQNNRTHTTAQPHTVLSVTDESTSYQLQIEYIEALTGLNNSLITQAAAENFLFEQRVPAKYQAQHLDLAQSYAALADKNTDTRTQLFQSYIQIIQ